MFGALGTILASGGLGSILGAFTGFVGNIINLYSTFKMQKLKFEHEEVMFDKTTEASIAEAKANMEIIRTETKGKIDLSEMDAFKESIKSDNANLFDKSYMQYIVKSKWLGWIAPVIGLLFAIMDVIKRSVRPFLTYYLVGVSTWLTILCFKILEALNGGLPIEDVKNWVGAAIFSILYMTVTCVTWHFGDRRAAKFLNRMFGWKEAEKNNSDAPF